LAGNDGDAVVTEATIASLMALGLRLARRYARARKMEHHEAELAGAAVDGLMRALARYAPSKGHLTPFAAKWMDKEVRKEAARERTRRAREPPAQDLEAPGPPHPAVAVEALTGSAVDALFSWYLGEELSSHGEARFLERETMAALHRFIEELDAHSLRLVTLRYWEDEPWNEVARALRIGERTAQEHDERIRDHLRERLIAHDRVRPLRRRA
jgi:RNA polymerase sigma factor (sigma-70 family)